VLVGGDGSTGEPCGVGYAEEGLFGLRTHAADDPWSRWEDTYYGGTNIEAASNIVFSNAR
jgi:hypothetical protein